VFCDPTREGFRRSPRGNRQQGQPAKRSDKVRGINPSQAQLIERPRRSKQSSLKIFEMNVAHDESAQYEEQIHSEPALPDES
jgi:hypothetical protein